MFLRAERAEGAIVQTVLVASTLPTLGGRSARNAIARWKPHALRALPRPDLLHCNHPMVVQQWHYFPGEGPDCFNEKVRLLVQFLRRGIGFNKKHQGSRNRLRINGKTMIF